MMRMFLLELQVRQGATKIDEIIDYIVQTIVMSINRTEIKKIKVLLWTPQLRFSASCTSDIGHSCIPAHKTQE